MKKVILPVLIGAFVTNPAKLSELLERLEIEDLVGCLKTVILISTAAIVKSLRIRI